MAAREAHGISERRACAILGAEGWNWRHGGGTITRYDRIRRWAAARIRLNQPAAVLAHVKPATRRLRRWPCGQA